ncbi:MAG: family 20 glycosylhydrolase [Oscillospiraceae bacterium]|nr:family 20 glycosylhydrolase [Oscillospiraceae bacterium]
MCYYMFDGRAKAFADPRLINDTIRKFFKSFCLGEGELTLFSGEENTFVMGDISAPVLSEGKEYALKVTETGAAVVGRDYGGLVRGFLVLLMKFEYEGDLIRIPVCEEESHYLLKNRMTHICVFPENDLTFIKKLIRLSALCQYTHIVIEFWGMLQYDCMKELSWPMAFSKAQAGELIAEARDLGLEPVPMFNQLGHATASRVCYGKHVVLEQNPRLQHLFTPDGWAWNIESAEVRELLRKVRAELYDLFGEGEYMHIGCDEAYFYTRSDEKRAHLPGYLHDLTSDVAEEGRRPMLWMDMLLERDKYPGCYTVCAPEDVEKLIGSLHPSSVMVDWQYDVKTSPVPTLQALKKTGFDVVGAPWYDPANYAAHVDTVVSEELFGLMLTTWHTLKFQMQSILGCAKKCGAVSFPWSGCSRLWEETATLLRKVSFEGNSYAESGWSKEQIEV